MNEDKLNSCPVCGLPLKVWYSLGGIVRMGCSDIKCSYKGEEVKL